VERRSRTVAGLHFSAFAVLMLDHFVTLLIQRG
jgi:hypothetical protein